MRKNLSHIGGDGRARMVDVSSKPSSARMAMASGKILLNAKTVDLIRKNEMAKGDVVATAKIAGIQAAKRTADLIPLCHPIPISDVEVEIELQNDGASVRCTAKTIAQTGVEMEALTGVAVALLTIYDMCKAVDKEMQIFEIRLVSKTKTRQD